MLLPRGIVISLLEVTKSTIREKFLLQGVTLKINYDHPYGCAVQFRSINVTTVLHKKTT